VKAPKPRTDRTRADRIRTARKKPAGEDGWTATYRRSPRTLAQFEAFIAVIHTAEQLQRGLTELLKDEDLSQSQYNMLRVLRGAGDAGLTCGEVGGRLVRHDPDVTRLADRLEQRGLIARTRDERDRRIVRAWITVKGLQMLGRLDAPIDALHEQQFGHLEERQLGELTALLAEAQSRVTG
jgi:MarR family transcriptional regulator, organic hydroperoxide resistance regulator